MNAKQRRDFKRNFIKVSNEYIGNADWPEEMKSAIKEIQRLTEANSRLQAKLDDLEARKVASTLPEEFSNERNYPGEFEDWYQNRCQACSLMFYGRKGRFICKVCKKETEC